MNRSNPVPVWISVLAAAATLAAQPPPPEAPPPPKTPPPALDAAPEGKIRPAEGPEPAEEFILEVDGTPRTVGTGEPFDVKIGDRTVTMRLKPLPYRVFSRAGVRFRYPRSHGFQAFLDNADAPLWVLTGSENVIQVQRFPPGRTAEDYRKELTETMRKDSGDPNARTGDVELALRGRPLKGTRVDVKMEGALLRYDIFCIPQGDAVTALTIQDVPDPGGRTSADTAAATKLLVESFEVEEAKGPPEKGNPSPK